LVLYLIKVRFIIPSMFRDAKSSLSDPRRLASAKGFGRKEIILGRIFSPTRLVLP
jgi:hypothetical protein